MDDFLIIGGGVVGCALARALAQRHPKATIALIEKEKEVAAHTSGRNSGVLHAGYNQKPGTLKAKFCIEGNREIREYCARQKVPFDPSGILIVARTESERPVLEELLSRGQANGSPDLRILEAAELARRESNVTGVAALLAPSGGAVDSAALVRRLAEEATAAGVRFHLGERVLRVAESRDGYEVRTARGFHRARRLINCAGLHADRIAHQLGAGLDYSIVPFRGEFYYLDEARSSFIRSMVYGVPDVRYPFLGVHWTKTVHGRVKVGPNAVLALGREAYRTFDIHPVDTLDMLSDRKFWRMAASPEFRRLAAENLRTSLSKKAFLERAFSLVKGAAAADFRKGPSGIRAQLVDRSGNLVDDILVERRGGSLHVLNAVSPGLTCSLPFADYLADQLA